MAAEMVPAMPQSVEAIATGGAAAGSAIAGAFSLGGAASTSAVVGGLAVAAVLGSGIAVGTLPVSPPPQETSVVAAADDDTDALSPTATASDPASDPGPAGPSPDSVPGDGGGSQSGTGVVSGVVDGVTGGVGQVVDEVVDTVDDTVTDVTNVVAQPVVVNVSVSGTGTPGGKVSLQAAGTVYATTTVGSNGKYSISVGGIPETVGSLSVVQKVDQSLLGGLVGGVVAVLKPLTISSSSTGGLGLVAVG